jgi:hypothetical protein
MCFVRYAIEGEQFLQYIFTRDETWVNKAIREMSSILA